MRTLIVEDDFTSRKLIQTYLSDYGECVVAVNGIEAIEAFSQSFEEDNPYDLVCLDIMMPDMDGMEALQTIRKIEDKFDIGGLDRTKVIMTTALDSSGDIFGAFRTGCEAYLVKPIRKPELVEEMQKLGLISEIPL